MHFDPGELNQRINILAPPTARNELNELVGDWTIAKRVWSRVRPMTAREMVAADQPQDEASYKFITRFSTSVSGINRIDWGGVIYDIKGEPLLLGGGKLRYMQIVGVIHRD